MHHHQMMKLALAVTLAAAASALAQDSPRPPSSSVGPDEVAIVLSASLPADTQATGVCAVRVKLSKEALAAIKVVRTADGWTARFGADVIEEENQPPRSGTTKTPGIVVETPPEKAEKALRVAVVVAKRAELEAALRKEHEAWLKRHPTAKKPFVAELTGELGLARGDAIIEWSATSFPLDGDAKKP
jgi:hypothetical protein